MEIGKYEVREVQSELIHEGGSGEKEGAESKAKRERGVGSMPAVVG